MLEAVSTAGHSTHVDEWVTKTKCKKKGKREWQMRRQRLQECLLQERAQSGVCLAPGSSYGALRTASHMQPQLSWTSSEGLSKQLEPDSSQAGQKAAVSGANKERTGLCRTNGQHHASGKLMDMAQPMHMSTSGSRLSSSSSLACKQVSMCCCLTSVHAWKDLHSPVCCTDMLILFVLCLAGTIVAN